MANVKITELTAETNPASTDVLPIVDVSADLTKKVSIADLLGNAGTGSAVAPSFSFYGDNDTGIYRPGANQIAISTNGIERLSFNRWGAVGLAGANYGSPGQIFFSNGSDIPPGWSTLSSNTLIGQTLWNEVIAEVQRVFELVEGTASVLLSAPATLTAGSTGPITVSVADAAYLADGTSITGVLGTVYGTLNRSGTTYSFVSNQSYTSNVTFATGTRFAAAFLNDTFNPLRIGSAQVEEDNSYAESDYAYVMLDAVGRVTWGVKADGSIEINKLGSLTGAFTGSFTGDLTGDVDADEIRVNKLIAPGGTIDLDSADTQLLNILEGGSFEGDVSPEDFYAAVEIDAAGRASRIIRASGEQYIPKLEVDRFTVTSGFSYAQIGVFGGFQADVTQGDFLIRALSPSGNDLADGSPSAPWATFAALKTWINSLPSQSKIKVLVKSGAYSEATPSPLYFQKDGLYSEVYFEENVSITMNQAGGPALSNAVGADRGEHHFFLNGASIVINADPYPATSDNGLGVHGGKVYVNGLTKTGNHASFVGFVDGTSNHNSGYLEVTGCDFSQSPKGAYTHVNTSRSVHRDCVFTGLLGSVFAIGYVEVTASADFYNCKFLPDPAATATQGAGVSNGVIKECQIGTLSQSVLLSALNCKVYGSYVNLVQNREPGNTTYIGCFGKYTNQNTSGNSNEARFLSCVFTGPGSFAPSSRFFVSGANFGKFYIFNSIITGYDKVIDVGGDAGRIALVNSWAMDGLCLFGNTNYADTGINAPPIAISADPLIGPANSFNALDYEILAGSPCRYAGLNSSNIGLPRETP